MYGVSATSRSASAPATCASPAEAVASPIFWIAWTIIPKTIAAATAASN